VVEHFSDPGAVTKMELPHMHCLSAGDRLTRSTHWQQFIALLLPRGTLGESSQLHTHLEECSWLLDEDWAPAVRKRRLQAM
jgi:hypothetical protein